MAKAGRNSVVKVARTVESGSPTFVKVAKANDPEPTESNEAQELSNLDSGGSTEYDAGFNDRGFSFSFIDENSEVDNQGQKIVKDAYFDKERIHLEYFPNGESGDVKYAYLCVIKSLKEDNKTKGFRKYNVELAVSGEPTRTEL